MSNAMNSNNSERPTPRPKNGPNSGSNEMAAPSVEAAVLVSEDRRSTWASS